MCVTEQDDIRCRLDKCHLRLPPQTARRWIAVPGAFHDDGRLLFEKRQFTSTFYRERHLNQWDKLGHSFFVGQEQRLTDEWSRIIQLEMWHGRIGYSPGNGVRIGTLAKEGQKAYSASVENLSRSAI